MLAFSIPGEWSALDLPWLSTSPPNVCFSLRRGASGVRRHCNVSVVFNEFSIVTGETQEASDVLTILRLRPICYRTCLVFLSVDAVPVNIKATKIDFLTSPGTFCMFGFETMFRQWGKHFMDMYDMFRTGTAVNHNLVEVHHDEFAFHGLQYAIYHAHHLAGCVRQAKRQDSPLVETECSRERPLLPVGRCDTNLMVTSHQIQLCEPAGAVKGVEQVLDMWKRITILDGYGVYCAILYAHRQLPVRLWHE